jgi:hypothetical protein
MLGLNWDVALPVGSVSHYTGNASGVGFELLFQYWATSHITVGAGMDWQSFWDSQPRTTYGIDNGALTATADNTVQNGAARFIARYYLLETGLLLPYAGLNAGIGWSTFQSTASTVILYDNTVSILYGGEIGLGMAPSPSSPLLTAGVRYTTLPGADFLGVTSVQTFTFQFGLASP